MRRTVTKCDMCETTVIDEVLDGGSELTLRKRKTAPKKSRPGRWPGYEWTITWHFCEPCTLKQRKKLTNKVGAPSEGDEDDY